MSYTNFAKHYDILMGDQWDCQDFIVNILPSDFDPKSVFEFWCGTGEILQLFSHIPTCHGIDMSSDMAQVAIDKLPNANIQTADITKYIFEQRYDLIMGIHDVMNHIQDIRSWEDIFKNVSKNLTNTGYFLFDINTLYQLEQLSQMETWKHNFEKNKYIQLKVQKWNTSIYTFNVDVFEKSQQNPILLYSEKIEQIGVPTDQIHTLLCQYFTSVETIDTEDDLIHETSKRIYFLCNNHE